jgi:hypothetical protein
MDKVSKIKEDIVLRKRAITQQKTSKMIKKPMGVIDCCIQALDSSTGFGRYGSII